MKKNSITILLLFLFSLFCMICLDARSLIISTFGFNATDTQNIKTETAADFMHISFDDTTLCFENLASNNYGFLFDEPFFYTLKKLHTIYGAKFSLYTYNSVLNQVPSKYAEDFYINRDWLKIGFHSDIQGMSLKNVTYEDSKQYWNNFVENIIRVCGSEESVDRLPRLEYFAGGTQALLGMRDANCGALGFLSADDNRMSYHFNYETMNYLYNNDSYYDEQTHLIFYSTDIRCDWWYNFSTANNYKKPIKNNIFKELIYRNNIDDFQNSFNSLIIFTHEWLVYDKTEVTTKINSIENACMFAQKYKIPFAFAQNQLN